MAEYKFTGFPRKDVSDKQKNEKYHLSWAKAVEAAIRSNNSGLDAGQRDWWTLMRLYAQGNQPQSLYKDYKFGEKGAPRASASQDGSWNNPGMGSREGIQNLSYDIVSIMPRIVDKLMGLLSNVDYNVLIDTVDSDSGAEKEQKKWGLWVQKQYGQFIKQFKENAGIPIQEPAYIPNSEYELELFESIGGFKLHIAKEMEKLIKHTYEISDWDGELRESVVFDLMSIAHAFMKLDLDPEDGKWKIKYIDPIDAIIPYMRNNDFGEMPYVGHYSWMTIADLRQHLNMSEKELEEFAKRYCDVYDNPSRSSWEGIGRRSGDGSYGYDIFKVKVMHLEWIDEGEKKTMYYKNRYGRKSAFKVQEGEKIKPPTEKALAEGVEQRIETTNYRLLRQTHWIVDSEVVFDWGPANFMERPMKNKVVPSYLFMKLKNQSITERLKTVMDDIMIAWIKYQDARAMAIKSGYAIDFTMLQNISDGDKKYSMQQVLEMWRDTGILLFQGSFSGKYEGGAVTPVNQIPGTAGQSLLEAADMWRLAMQKIEDLTGLSPVALGSMPQGQTATGTELGVAATADILKPLIKRVLLLKEKTARSLIRRIQSYCVDDYMDVYAPVIGELAIKRLKEAVKSPVQYGMSFEARPTDQEKQDLIMVIQASMNNRRQGMYGIDLATGAWAIEQLNHGANMKEIRMVVAYQEEKHRQQLDQEKQEAIKLQGEQNAQLKQMEVESKQMEMQAEMAKIQAESQSKLQEIQSQIMGDILKDYLKERPEEAKQFISGQGSQNNGENQPVEPLSPQSDMEVPLEEEVPNM